MIPLLKCSVLVITSDPTCCGGQGQEFGNAIADLLFGVASPQGKLPLTLPNKDNEMDFTQSQWPGTNIPPRGGYCKPGSYKVTDGGCYNDTNHQCGFGDVGQGSRTNNSWLNAATVCNEVSTSGFSAPSS